MVWEKLRWLEPTRHKRGLLGGCDAHAGGETSVGTYKLDETIEKSCSDLLAIHQRQCIFGKMEIFSSPTGDEITTHGECVQPR